MWIRRFRLGYVSYNYLLSFIFNHINRTISIFFGEHPIRPIVCVPQGGVIAMNYAEKLRCTVLFAVGMAFAACASKKSFKGGANTATATAEQNPEEGETPEVDKETPEVEEETPEVETDNVFKDCAKSASAQFQGDLYELPPQAKRLPDFEKLTAIKKICLKQIDITARSFTEGFPGVDGLKEWFAIKFDFNLKIEKEGDYQFVLNSDDGSKLYIDGKEIIDHDGQHAPAEKSSPPIRLTAGIHKISLPYFQGPADRIALELFWIPPGGSREYIPAELISRAK